ncbi:hypothetical protein BGZ46_008764 [Entomortierella lignicola]|nr:hypothetical protein BGZ46_008764 [Entomortierella lignicola]
MSETCAQTLEEIETHVNRYNVLFGYNDSLNSNEGDAGNERDTINEEDSSESLEVQAIINAPYNNEANVIPSTNDKEDPGIYLNNLSISSQPLSVSSLKIPRSHKITAPQVNEISHTRRQMKRRENRLKEKRNIDVKNALTGISERGQMLKAAQDMDEIDSVRQYHVSVRDELRAFEFSVVV